MKRPRFWPVWLMLLLYVLYQSWPELRTTFGIGLKQGDVFPEFVFNSANGEPVDNRVLQGRITVVNFWATWCPPCKKEIPFLNDLHVSWSSRGLQVIGVNTDEVGRAVEVERFIRQFKLRFENYSLYKELRRELGGLPLMPTTYVVTPDGRVARIITGALNEDAFKRELSGLLEANDTGLKKE